MFIIIVFTRDVRVKVIDQDDVGGCRKDDKSHKQHFYLKVSMAGKGYEQTDEEAQSA